LIDWCGELDAAELAEPTCGNRANWRTTSEAKGASNRSGLDKRMFPSRV
jgi:hypothetical protein